MSVNPMAAHAVSVLVSLGWTRIHAIGAVANLEMESGLNPHARGDFHHGVPTAFGICQHHMDRVESILHGCGVDMMSASLEQQLAGLNWEMRHTQIEAFEAVSRATTPFQAGYAFCQFFERPANLHQQATLRGNMAAELAHAIG